MASQYPIQVFIASTREDLEKYRKVAEKVVVHDFGWRALAADNSQPQPTYTVETCREWVRGSDLLLLIIAHRRGWIPKPEQGGDGHSSITAIEYREADRHGIPVLALFADETWPGTLYEDEGTDWIREFREEINRPVGFFPYERGEQLPEFEGLVRKALLDFKERLLEYGHVVLGCLLLMLEKLLKPVSITGTLVHQLYARWAPDPSLGLSRSSDPRALLKDAIHNLAMNSPTNLAGSAVLGFIEDLGKEQPDDVAEVLTDWLQRARRLLSACGFDPRPRPAAEVVHRIERESAPRAEPQISSEPIGAGRFHALLIAAGHHDGKLFDGSQFPHLLGCANDVLSFEAYLIQSLGIPPDRIRTLVAQPSALESSEYEQPTYGNIVAAFEELARANPGDIVYVYYSGHAIRLATAYPELKGPRASDVALVPSDLGHLSARYIRDLDFMALVRKITERKILVSLALDCCHAGGLILPSMSNSHEEERESPGKTLNAGCLVLAACRPTELAFEHTTEQGESRGAFTYWLLDALRQIGPHQSAKSLYGIVTTKVKEQFPRQTPMLFGDGERIFFGKRYQPAAVILVLAVRPPEQVLLNIGQSQGLRIGAQLEIYSSPRPRYPPRKVAIVEVIEIGATESWAKIVPSLRRGSVEAGMTANLLKLGTTRLQSAIQLLNRETNLGAAERTAFSIIRNALEQQGGGFLRLAEGGEMSDFQVGSNNGLDYEILDSAGRVIPIKPVLPISQPGAASELLHRLTHLTKFRNACSIENTDGMSPLNGKLELRVPGAEIGGIRTTKREELQPGLVELKVGEGLTLEILNHSSRVLNITALDLQPDWGIAQIFPTRSDGAFWPLGPGESKSLRIRAFLPPGLEEGRDIIKVFGSLGAVNFRWLELPPLGRPHRVTRNAVVSAFPGEEWTTEQMEIRVRR